MVGTILRERFPPNYSVQRHQSGAKHHGLPSSSRRVASAIKEDPRTGLLTAVARAFSAGSTGFADAYLNRGFAWYSTGEFKHAITDFAKAIELDPTPLAYHDRGLARMLSGDIERAIADFNQAVELDPRNGDAYFGRGLSTRRRGTQRKGPPTAQIVLSEAKWRVASARKTSAP
jgi:tetratricopeptide (TPR) repeat protein